MERTLPEAHLQDPSDLAVSRTIRLGRNEPPWRLVAVDRQSILTGVVRFADLLAAILGAVAAYLLRYETAEMAIEYWTMTLLGGLLLVNYLQISRSYEFEAIRSLRKQVAAIVSSWCAVVIALISLAYFLKVSEGFSRIWMVIWFCTTVALLVASRSAVALVIEHWQHHGQLARRVAIIGTYGLVTKIARRLRSIDGIEIVASHVFSQRELIENGSSPISDSAADLLELARSGQIDEIIVAPRSVPNSRLHNLLRTLRTLAIDVRLYSTGLEQPVPSGTLAIVFGMPMLSIVERPLTGWTRVAKRCEDIVVSSLLLFLLMPLMALIAVAVKLDSRGPVLFHQDRYGFNNNLIGIYKFRTMHHRADVNHSAEQARRNDARVTRLGRFLRRSSLDELPQLFNVLKGEMSLVGPRPHPVLLNEKFADVIDGYLARHRVKPGITGWAQVNGLRGETDTIDKMRKRVEHDLYYIDNWSLLFDLKILFLTVFVGFLHENAY